MAVFAVFGLIAVILALTLKGEDNRGGYGLELPNVKKD